MAGRQWWSREALAGWVGLLSLELRRVVCSAEGGAGEEGAGRVGCAGEGVSRPGVRRCDGPWGSCLVN